MAHPRDCRTPWLPFPEPAEPALSPGDAGACDAAAAWVDRALHLERAAHAGLVTAGMAHDVLNHLTAVLGCAEAALAAGRPDDLRSGLREVLDHGGRIHESLDAYLAFVRRRDHRVRAVPVADIVQGAVRMAAPAARGESVVLLSTVASRASVLGDPQLLEQAVVNLALNAIHAAAQGAGRAAVTATDAPSGAVRITVRDTGPGIREDVRGRLFEPFVTSRPDGGGHGLGLWTVREIVRRYGGTVAVESSDAGTRVDVELPAAASAPLRATQPA